MLDDAAVLLRRAGHEAGHVDEGDHRDVERIAEPHEARRLDAALDVQAAGQHHRVVGDDAHALAVHAAETDDDVLRVLALQLEEVAIVHDLVDQFADLIGLVRVVGHQRVQAAVDALGGWSPLLRIGGFSRFDRGR